ncbi:MAG: BACON domain-containing protein [Porphyromonas sp.]|nr:BACON domain-containing protein [Porphyromonas sp.]
MKRPLLTLLLLPMLLLFGSCTPENDIEEATLTLSESGTITFTKEASEKVITIETNQPQIIASSNAPWLSTKIEGKQLTIKAEGNETLRERKGTVLVSVGRAQQALKVIQSQSGLIIQLYPETLKSTQWGGKFSVDVLANNDRWTASTDADWLRVEALPNARSMNVEVYENTETESRTAKIKLSLQDGSEDQEFVVTQEGIMFYIMPFVDFEDGSRISLKLFEQRRRSLLTDENSSTGWIGFTTQSPAFPDITYTLYHQNALLYAQLNASNKEYLEGEHLRKVIDRLRENGFTDERTADRVYYNPDKRILCEIKPDYGKTPHILFSYQPKQPQAHTTFTDFPYPFGTEPEVTKDVTFAEVAAYEAERKGKERSRMAHKNGYLRFAIYDNEDPEEPTRAYFFSDKKSEVLEASVRYFRNMNYAFWDYRGYPLFTEEFLRLAEQEGFSYVGLDRRDRNRHVFVNSARKIEMRIHWDKYQGMKEHQLILRMTTPTN